MEDKLKKELQTNTLEVVDDISGGCISSSKSYLTDSGRVFIKFNKKEHAARMFNGEMEGLLAIVNTQTIRVPKPIKVIQFENVNALVMEYLEIVNLSRYQASLGEQLARMHLRNLQMIENEDRLGTPIDQEKAIRKFGFHTTTCCGYIPLDNTWCNSWIEFFTQRRLKYQVNLIDRTYQDPELRHLWPCLENKINQFFKEIEIKPSLLHGDLWNGNVAETPDMPVILDPACFYGHSEFDLSIAKLFGGFKSAFYTSYHKLIPKKPGFDKRQELYALFHYLNHWNHFGSSYRSSSIETIKKLLRWMK